MVSLTTVKNVVVIAIIYIGMWALVLAGLYLIYIGVK